MRIKKTYIGLLLVLALLLAFSGAYAGVKLAQANDSDSQGKGETINQGNNSANTLDSSDINKVKQTYSLIKDNYIEDIGEDKLTEGAIKGMLDVLDDPFTSYMDAKTMESFNEQIESSFEGIGAEVSKTDGEITIVSPIKDSPAEEAGLRPNDKVLSVDGESLTDYELDEAVNKIRGEKGSEVVLNIKRSGVSDPFKVTLVRDEIPVETVYSDMKTVDGKKTGILEISSFSERTAKEFTKQLNELEDNGMQGLVIDVRGNPGGILKVVEDILGLFIPKDMPYLQIENADGVKTPHYSDLDVKKEYPVDVLINEGSASASEILAVAMKEAGYDVIGETSYGKGTVQRAMEIDEDGSAVKITMSKWLSPKGNWINEKGVEPTVEIRQPEYYYTSPVDVEDALKYDQTGDKVENAQIMLQGLGYDTGRKDGYFNKETKQAVKAFQTDEQLSVTGKVNDETAGKLEEKIIKKVREGDDDQQLDKALHVLYQ